MLWPTNYERLAIATMFTLFFSGNTFAPSSFVYDAISHKNIPIQNYLQEHYFGAVRELAGYLVNETNLIGFDTLNVSASDLYSSVPSHLSIYLPSVYFLRLGTDPRVCRNERLTEACFSSAARVSLICKMLIGWYLTLENPLH